MTNSVYKKLAKHLDRLPGGFPETDTGVELRILKRLFLPEEARFALNLLPMPEPAKVIARRAGVSEEDAKHRLETMAKKGLILRLPEQNGRPPAYMAAQYVVGIWEYHVNDLSPELIKDMEEYQTYLLKEAWKRPQLRTVPVGRSISAQLEVMTYENAEDLVKSKKKALTAPCICRRERRIMGEGCDHPIDYCLTFDIAADYYEHRGIGRVIEIEEAIDILRKADKAGLVLQPGNSRDIVNICCCCGCSCGILRNLKKFPEPAKMVSSPFVAKAVTESCKGCGVCVKRCQMEAISMVEDKVSLNTDRCIGCGLCVSTCPTGSLTLVRKPETEKPPADMIQAAIAHGRARGKMADLVMMQVRSKLDRLLALKKF